MNRRAGQPRRLKIGRWVVLAAALLLLVKFFGGETDTEASQAALVEAPAFTPLVYGSTTTAPLPDTVGALVVGEITPGVAVSTALARKDVGGADIDAIVAALRPHFDWRVARPGHTFELLKGEGGDVRWFRYVAGPTTVLHAYRDVDGQMRGVAEAVHVRTSTVFVEGEIEHSLSLAMQSAGESDVLTMMFVELFAWDIDFFTETQKGDRFRIIAEKRTSDGRNIGYGKILAAEYTFAAGRSHQAFHYTGENGQGGYYEADGAAVKKAFLKSPIQFASITSRYGMRRHPVLKYKRAHRGVDYGAPRGTAIWAMGHGTVKYAGRKGGYGNVVYIRHANGLETRYAHLKGYGKGIRSGKRVAQKQVIGYVGSTGLATGPHLHFEVLKGGRHVNPLSVRMPRAPPVPKKEKARFEAAVAPLVSALEAGRAVGG